MPWEIDGDMMPTYYMGQLGPHGHKKRMLTLPQSVRRYISDHVFILLHYVTSLLIFKPFSYGFVYKR